MLHLNIFDMLFCIKCAEFKYPYFCNIFWNYNRKYSYMWVDRATANLQPLCYTSGITIQRNWGCNTSLGFQWRDMYLLFGFTIQSDLWTITLILPRDPKEIMLFYISVQREMRRWCDFVQGVSMTQKETHNTLYFIIPRCCAWNYLSNDTITSKTEKCSFPPSWLKLAKSGTQKWPRT